ncbi:MAG TPA: CRISPR-associated endonuclease Cas3'' [Spirochaetota bacterium]|nr:CRISPR-associated endonuclease Cas3'' [Spirochaetota bacterium]
MRDNYLKYIAHAKKDNNDEWKEHLLTEHLAETARLSGEFAQVFGNSDWAELAGYWHDLGKYLPEWQKYIRKQTGYDIEAHIETVGGRPNHSTTGAILSFQRFIEVMNNSQYGQAIGSILGYIIAGHHAGLPDWYYNYTGESLPNRVFLDNQLRIEELNNIKSIDESLEFINKSLPSTSPIGIKKGKEQNDVFHLWIRILFSCLVDADYLDTESFMKPQQSELRGNYNDIKELKKRFDDFIDFKQKSAEDTSINRQRNLILSSCRDKAILAPGFFSLNVPTGGGKTLSSMAFALEHAFKYDKKRIIMAIPYTSIIEQTAKVYKYGTDNDEEIKKNIESGKVLFGEEAVLEHHSNIDPEKESYESSLATENWDAPIIVTTNVQLFESLFASKPSDCRKLHNIVNSIIILDEAQMLPPEYLKPILSVLQGLVEYFGVTVVLCTATQPALEGNIGSQGVQFQGLQNVAPIIEEPEKLADEFKRVEIIIPTDLTIRTSWENIAEELIEYEQVICIVNKRNDCRDLHSLMPEGTIHLSALMCGEERSKIISGIKSDLRKGKSVRVISTQLVEAGVDIDFPVVYRALAGMDSIAQAAGRCNREGMLNNEGKLGKVVVFNPPKLAPVGLLRKGEDASKSLIRLRNKIELKPDIFHDYFRIFYASVNDFDRARFSDRLVKESGDFKFQFRTFAQDFKLIDDQKQKGIIVCYKGERNDSRELIEKLIKSGPDYNLLRKLQRFTVNVPERIFKNLMEDGFISDTETHGYAVQFRQELYRAGTGLMYDPAWDSSSLVF